MHSQSVARWQHEHAFLGKKHDVHERRTWVVVALATVMMITEIVGREPDVQFSRIRLS